MGEGSSTTTFSKESMKEAEEFVEEIKSGKLKKRIPPNEYFDYPIEEALESFKGLVVSQHYVI